MADFNPYKILGIEEGSTKEQIKQAYRNAARKYHPDRNNSDPLSESRFKDATEAYQQLVKEESNNFDNPIFSGKRWNSGIIPKRGSDISVDLRIPLPDTYSLPKVYSVNYIRLKECEDCSGSGIKPGGRTGRCSDCGGTGKRSHSRSIGSTFANYISTCISCEGRGWCVPRENHCDKCNGKGNAFSDESIEVPISIQNITSKTIVISGMGNCGENDGPPGDLLVNLHVDYSFFRPLGEGDLFLVIDICVFDLLVGTNISVNLPSGGSASVKIPKLFDPSRIIRLKGQGLSKGVDDKGDLLIRVKCQMPEFISAENELEIRRIKDASKEQNV